MKWTLAAFGALAAFAATTSAYTATVVTAAHMFDPAKGVTVDNPVVVIGDNGRIMSLSTGNAARPQIPADAKRVDMGMSPSCQV